MEREEREREPAQNPFDPKKSYMYIYIFCTAFNYLEWLSSQFITEENNENFILCLL